MILFRKVSSPPKLYKLHKNSGNILGFKNSSSKIWYFKTNERVEKISKIINFVVIKFTPQYILWPKFIISYFTYFTTDSGADAFELPFLTW